MLLMVSWIAFCLMYPFTIAQITITLSPGYNSLPTGLYGAITVSNSRNELLVIGGCKSYVTKQTGVACLSSHWSNDIYIWKPELSPVFTKNGSIPSNLTTGSFLFNPSGGYPSPIDNDILYIPYHTTIHKYDTLRNQWIFGSPIEIPIPVVYSCNVYDKINRKIYLLGGKNSIHYAASVQVYNIVSNTWTLYSDIAYMPYGVYGGSCVLIDAFIYYFGGRHEGDRVSLGIFKYSVDTNTWVTFSDVFPRTSKVFGSGTIILNDTYVFIVGGAGYDYYTEWGTILAYGYNTIYYFNRSTETIHVAANMDKKRYAPHIALVNQRLYIAGGLSINSYASYTVFSDSTISTETWTDSVTGASSTNAPTQSVTELQTTEVQPTLSTDNHSNTETSGFEYNRIYGMLCSNLAENARIEYNIDLNQCILRCNSIGPDCRMINYFQFFKTNDDSRCYVFDEMCKTQLDDTSNQNENRSMIAYRIFPSECIDFPVGWRDNIGDACSMYGKPWCDNGHILKNKTEFGDYTDSYYDLTAMEACCVCNGGIHIKDDVALSFDDNVDVLCDFSLLNTKYAIRTWDNLELFGFCVDAMGHREDCEFLIDTQYANTDVQYTIFVCEFNQSMDSIVDANDFSVHYASDISNTNYMMYVNTLWFGIDGSYYSSVVNVTVVSYENCKNIVLEGNHHTVYSINACYLDIETDTPTTNVPTTDSPTTDTPTTDIPTTATAVLSTDELSTATTIAELENRAKMSARVAKGYQFVVVFHCIACLCCIIHK